MRSTVVVLVLLVLVAGELVNARADGPAVPAAQVAPTPMAIAPTASGFCIPHRIDKSVAPESPGYATRGEHLRQAAEHLQAAGMSSLAEHVRGLAYVPFAPEAPHPLAGAGGMPPSPATRQVVLTVKLVEIETEKLRQLGFDFSQLGNGQGPEEILGLLSENTQSVGVGTLKILSADSNVLKMIEALRTTELARVLGEPKLVTQLGRPAHFRTGGVIPLWTLGPDRQPIQRMEHYGTTVEFIPHLTEGGNLRLELHYEYSEVDRRRTEVVSGKKNPAINHTRMVTGCEVRPGQTLAAAIHPRRSDGDGKGPQKSSIVLLVTPELVDPVPTETATRRLPPK